MLEPGFPFSILIHSRTDTSGLTNAKFEYGFEPEGPFHYVSTDQLCLVLAKSTDEAGPPLGHAVMESFDTSRLRRVVAPKMVRLLTTMNSTISKASYLSPAKRSLNTELFADGRSPSCEDPANCTDKVFDFLVFCAIRIWHR